MIFQPSILLPTFCHFALFFSFESSVLLRGRCKQAILVALVASTRAPIFELFAWPTWKVRKQYDPREMNRSSLINQHRYSHDEIDIAAYWTHAALHPYFYCLQWSEFTSVVSVCWSHGYPIECWYFVTWPMQFSSLSLSPSQACVCACYFLPRHISDGAWTVIQFIRNKSRIKEVRKIIVLHCG